MTENGHIRIVYSPYEPTYPAGATPGLANYQVTRRSGPDRYDYHPFDFVSLDDLRAHGRHLDDTRVATVCFADGRRQTLIGSSCQIEADLARLEAASGIKRVKESAIQREAATAELPMTIFLTFDSGVNAETWGATSAEELRDLMAVRFNHMFDYQGADFIKSLSPDVVFDTIRRDMNVLGHFVAIGGDELNGVEHQPFDGNRARLHTAFGEPSTTDNTHTWWEIKNSEQARLAGELSNTHVAAAFDGSKAEDGAGHRFFLMTDYAGRPQVILAALPHDGPEASWPIAPCHVTGSDNADVYERFSQAIEEFCEENALRCQPNHNGVPLAMTEHEVDEIPSP